MRGAWAGEFRQADEPTARHGGLALPRRCPVRRVACATGRSRVGFGGEFVEVGAGDVAGEDLLEVFAEVTAGGDAINPQGAGTDAVGTELGGERDVVEELILEVFGPRAMVEGVQALDEIATEKFGRLFVADEYVVDVNKEEADEIGVGDVAAEGLGGLARQLGPIGTGEIGERKQGFPNVGGAIVEGFGDLGTGSANLGFVIEDEASAFAAEIGAVEVFEAGALFAGGFALHADDDAAVGEGFRESADAGDDFGAPAGKCVN